MPSACRRPGCLRWINLPVALNLPLSYRRAVERQPVDTTLVWNALGGSERRTCEQQVQTVERNNGWRKGYLLSLMQWRALDLRRATQTCRPGRPQIADLNLGAPLPHRARPTREERLAVPLSAVRFRDFVVDVVAGLRRQVVIAGGPMAELGEADHLAGV